MRWRGPNDSEDEAQFVDQADMPTVAAVHSPTPGGGGAGWRHELQVLSVV